MILSIKYYFGVSLHYAAYLPFDNVIIIVQLHPHSESQL